MASERFPLSIKRGSVTVKVYRLVRGDGRLVYTMAAHVGGKRETRQFTELADAKAEATLKAEQLAAGRVEAAAMSLAERDEYIAARKAAAGVPLLTIVQEWQRARALAGADIVKACEAWSVRHGQRAPSKTTVADAISAFLAAKRAAHVDTKPGYDRTLPRFQDRFGTQPIAAVSDLAISTWLAEFKHPVTYNSHRKRVVAFFRWSRKRGLLPLDTLTAAERTDPATEKPRRIGLITPAQLRSAFALISNKAPHYIPALAIAAFCGLRPKEIHGSKEEDGQLWQDLDLERKVLRVSAAKPNTPAYRRVPIPDCAVEWLLEHRQKEGPICTNLAIDRIRDICRTASLDLADNGFRHSWISARVAQTGNIPATSMEAGNSVKVIHAHYLELIGADEAADWFSVTPNTVKAASSEEISEKAATA